eukprot:5962807-Prymnesium_polylepis.1
MPRVKSPIICGVEATHVTNWHQPLRRAACANSSLGSGLTTTASLCSAAVGLKTHVSSCCAKW